MNPLARKLLAYAAVLAVLVSVFALYLQPALVVSLADRLWACF